ncbi:MAG TPA: hypothetical protein VMV17_00965 [Streptosporangiaceae bacterium]|nr:hypothetical protein [Streptosporangiaceae bacterium]
MCTHWPYSGYSSGEKAAIEKVALALAGLGPPAGRVTVPAGTVRPLPDPAGPAGVVSG